MTISYWKSRCEILEKKIKQLQKESKAGTDYEYLLEIAEKENLNGKTTIEEERAILIKYFNGYTFRTEKEMKWMIYAFLDIVPVYLGETELLLKSLSERYNFLASANDLTLIIKDEPYPYKDIDSLFLPDEEPPAFTEEDKLEVMKELGLI